MTKENTTRGARQNARICAMQCFYAFRHSNTPVGETRLHLLTEWDSEQLLDRTYLGDLITGILEEEEALQDALVIYGERPLTQITPIEYATCLIGLYELKAQWTVPIEVVIDESIEIAKGFGAEGSHKFVNSVLDKAAKILRQASDT